MLNRRTGIGMNLFLSMFVAISTFALAHDPITQATLQAYANDGSLGARKARLDSLQQHRMAKSNGQKAVYKMSRANLEAAGFTPAAAAQMLAGGPQQAFPFTIQPELRSTGTVKTLTVLIDFKDQKAVDKLPNLTVDGIRTNIYGTGTTEAQNHIPHESLHEYYRRASQGLVDVQGNVLGWHHFAKNRADYEPEIAPVNLPILDRRNAQAFNDNLAIFKMLSEALKAFDANHDFTQYDNDNDGDIDLVTILYAGPDTGWGGFWWAYRWEFFVPQASDNDNLFDGKKAKQFVFQFVDTRGQTKNDFDPTTLLHEMGHAFGLADYYDYDSQVGPPGGVGGLDMMHANKGNHNAFSRWLLDWIKPTVIGSAPLGTRTLWASSSDQKSDKAIAIFPGLSSTFAPSQEIFLIENRQRMGNDAKLPGDGLVIWHVDATPNSNDDDFQFDNSFTQKKLVRLMRADNANDFGPNEMANAGTYFLNGKSFTPTSIPNSNDSTGSPTGISIDQISAVGEKITLRVGFSNPMPQAVVATPVLAANPNLVPGQVTVDNVLDSDVPANLDVLESLNKQLSLLKPTELEAIWTKAASALNNKKSNVNRILVGKCILANWASKTGEPAAKALAALDRKDPLRSAGLPVLCQAWVSNEPAQAAVWYLDQKTLTSDERKAIAQLKFTHEAFEGLYMLNAKRALEAVENLSTTADSFAAMDGILHAQKLLGKDIKSLQQEFLRSKSEVVKARMEVILATQAATDKIKDPKKRAEFERASPHK